MILLKRLAAVFWLLSLFLTHPCFAATITTDDQQIQTLAASPQWHRLLHYEPGFSGHRVESQVDDARFFLAADGKHNPVAELKATLAAFYAALTEPGEEQLNQHAMCRFPARWQFLHEQLKLPLPPLTQQQCPEFNQWMNTLKPHSISLIFASSYLNSPSSMFGHTFLRVDPANVETGSTWLSYAINFGAELNSDDNSLLYAYKGLFGGYPGFFSVIRYYEKIKEYSRIENRDLWEYNLNLTPAETRTMISHLWELRDVIFDYYFFDENCSYRLLELLEVARPGTSLRDEFGARAIPIDTVRAVIDGGFVASVTYRPSVATLLEHDVNRLSDGHQLLAWQLAHRRMQPDDPRLTELDPAARARIYSAAYEYLRYLELENPRTPAMAQYSLDLLKAVSRLPLKKTTPPTPAVPPEEGHKTLLVGLTGGEQADTGFADLRMRLSYHDLADNRAGYLDGAAINIGELRLRKRESDSIQIEQLNVVDINSHAPRTLFLNPITWRVKAGLERIYSDSDDDLAAQVHGGAGVTYGLGDQVLVYGMAMARLEYNALLDHNWGPGLGALAGSLIYLPLGTLQLESSFYQYTDGLERYQHQLIQNIPIGRDNAVRLSASHQKQVDTRFDEFSLEFRHYF
ncbi:MAG: hypothetical protein CMK83_26795 [Pseudomonadales bacterium]|nr:hypothetical protein [Pseudomonadales bacterium]RLT91713.1 MAG: DUF4105 domain-containing protein [Ketobacter sp. GenoA1]RLT92418.1 MAG: DUF4105 domain-containing protein [Ketobacter sp.]TNC86479.1 MAG: hypothetical protein CSH49_16390 [Alcanivorax sp.]HBO94994.1 hypothetical protein [Gammaproteobacteria bacterium]|tara:strand:+ start:8666 stop:10555 length:1890 start_codon:yes stop_codon:yes gene_type:complete